MGISHQEPSVGIFQDDSENSVSTVLMTLVVPWSSILMLPSLASLTARRRIVGYAQGINTQQYSV